MHPDQMTWHFSSKEAHRVLLLGIGCISRKEANSLGRIVKPRGVASPELSLAAAVDWRPKRDAHAMQISIAPTALALPRRVQNRASGGSRLRQGSQSQPR